MKENESQEEIVVPKDVQVFDDQKTHAKTVAFPFQFPDGTSGILMVSRLQKMGWKPSEIIEKIVITYR